MKESVPITAMTKTFPNSHKNKTVTAHRVQIPLKLEHTITMHNSQSSTLEYMKRNFDRRSKNGKLNTVSINQGAIYMILSRFKSRDGELQLVNFE